MTNWFTSDTHFNHRNIIRYCNRPFYTVDQMNKILVGNWNSLVSPDDVVYFLGDFCFTYARRTREKRKDILKWKEKLNGHIILIRGNHDYSDTRHLFKPECHDELALNIGPYNCMLAHRPLYPDYWDIPERDLTNHFARKAENTKNMIL